MARYTFKRRQRLSRRDDFKRALGSAGKAVDDRLVVYVVENGLPFSRLGISIGKRFGPAVQRNRFKRLVREAFRLLQHDLPDGLNILVIPRAAPPSTLEGYRQSLLALTHRAVRKLRRHPE